MNIERLSKRIGTLLITLGLAAWAATAASAQVAEIYCARMSSNDTTNWDAPFWWIPGPGNSPYGISDHKSAAAGTPGSRVGSYYHTPSILSPGEGFGVVCTACNGGPGAVYQVDVTQPNYLVATDTIFGVCSTNCTVGGLSGGGGYATNTTVFQAAYSVDKWGFVCWLTNTLGARNPEIEFHYVSGGPSQTHQYADCVRFTQLSFTSGPAPVRISGFAGNALQYSGGSGTRFVLLKCTTLGNWERIATNSATPSSFPIESVGTEAAAFYAVASE
jgi:hypothetical protein